MSRSVSRKGLKAEPNLTPMLDMVFQLVTFFMLVINFKANQIDTQMESARRRHGPPRGHQGSRSRC